MEYDAGYEILIKNWLNFVEYMRRAMTSTNCNDEVVYYMTEYIRGSNTEEYLYIK